MLNGQGQGPDGDLIYVCGCTHTALKNSTMLY